MYETSFGFTRPPFTDPDGRDFQPCGVQAAVLADLGEALDAGTALIVLSGPIGTGKTTLLRRALGQPSERRHVVLFWNAHVGPDDLLNYLCDDLQLRSPGTHRSERMKALRTALVRGLSEGWRLLIAVDDAQNLPEDTLAELHALLDLRELGHGLVQVLLCGQPELQERLLHDPQRDAHPPQRLMLRTLDAAESAAFIAARLSAAGRPDAGLFDDAALVRIHELAHGVPRLLNRICNQSLLLAYLGSERQVTAALVRDVAADTPPTEPPPQPSGPLYEPMPARPAIAAESVPHMHAPAPDPVPAAAPAALAAQMRHDAGAHHGHHAQRSRNRWWLGLAAIASALAIAGFAAWRNGWLPLLPPPPPRASATSAPQSPAPATVPATDAVAIPSPGKAAAAVVGVPPAATADDPAAPVPVPAPVPTPTAPAAPVPATTDLSPARTAATDPVAPPPRPLPDSATEAPAAPAAQTTVAPPPAAAPAGESAAVAPPASPEATATGPTTAPTEDAVASAIRALLAQARSQYAGMRYTQPPDDNALQTWRQVLTLAPGNAEALAGIAGIRTRFIGWGRQAQARGEFERALRHYEIARGIGEDEELSGLIAEARRRRDGGR